MCYILLVVVLDYFYSTNINVLAMKVVSLTALVREFGIANVIMVKMWVFNVVCCKPCMN